MARSAARLGTRPAQERVFPEGNFAVRRLNAINGDALAIMTSRAAEFLRRMSIVRQKNLAPGVSFERIRLLLEAGPIDCQMAGLTARLGIMAWL